MNNPSFKFISSYKQKYPELQLPSRATEGSAGYDFVVAEDTIIPGYQKQLFHLEMAVQKQNLNDVIHKFSLEEVNDITKKSGIKPTLVPTGIKAYIPEGQYLQLSVRSSCPLKNWLILANGVGIIDSDYYDNPDNEGHIYFQIINLFPYDIILHKGDKIGQGVFLNYNQTADDIASKKKRSGGFGSTSSNFNVHTSKFC